MTTTKNTGEDRKKQLRVASADGIEIGAVIEQGHLPCGLWAGAAGRGICQARVTWAQLGRLHTFLILFL